MKIEPDLNVLIKDLKSELDLIFKTDEWLYQERVAITSDIDQKVNELDKIYKAIKIKRLLQQKNQVAIRNILKTESGSIKDIIVKIMSLPEAIDLLEKTTNQYGAYNYMQHLKTWESDGYDIARSSKLKFKNKKKDTNNEK